MNYKFCHQQSDSQTIQQTETIQQPIVTLEYLLNQNKMKEIALGKATHLIQLYKIELQVKQQDYLKQLDVVRQMEKENYEGVITQLEEKILDLERQLRMQEGKLAEKQRIIKQSEHIIKQQQQKLLRQKVVGVRVNTTSEQLPSTYYEKLNDSSCIPPKMARNSSGKNLLHNRRMSNSQSKAGVHNKNNSSSTMKRSYSGMLAHNNSHHNQQQLQHHQLLYRIEKTFLIDYLLRSEQKDQHILSQLQTSLSLEQQYFNQMKSTMKGNDKFMEGFIKVLKQPTGEMENRLRHYQEVVKIQELIIEQLNGQLNQYENLFHATNSAIMEIFQSQPHSNTKSQPQTLLYTHENHLFQQFRDIIDNSHITTHNKLKQHKTFIKQKIHNMQTENKQLKRILQDMIKLIKTNKKINSIALTNQKLSSFATANYESVSSSTNTNKHERPTSFSQSGNSKISAFGCEGERQHYGNLTNVRVREDGVSMSREKVSSQVVYRK